MDMPDYGRKGAFSGDFVEPEKRLLAKDLLNMMERNKSGTYVYDGLWKQMYAVVAPKSSESEASDLEVVTPEASDSEAFDPAVFNLEACDPCTTYFDEMVLVVVLKSYRQPGKSVDVLQAVHDRWYQILDPEYLHGKGIEMKSTSRVRLGGKTEKRRLEASAGGETRKKRKSS
jgi:hypothetical protein